MRIIDRINECIAADRPFFSLEFFPPKTDEGLKNLYSRADRLTDIEPLFIDITWGAGGTTSERTSNICDTFQNHGGLEVMMHLTCTNMPVESVKQALEKAKASGIQNILALRGDPPKGAQSWTAVEGGFNYALDLVRFIRKEYGSYFGIGVAGYPEKHSQAPSYEEDLKHLKAKVDAGADFIVTQMFYDTDLFLKFVADCRAIGIACPIIPGVMPIQNYKGFRRMTELCGCAVPESITSRVEAVKDDAEQLKQTGVEIAIEMCRKIRKAGTPGIHFYTLNLERSVTKILNSLGFEMSSDRKRLPWEPSQDTKRSGEGVRPIFWANRPHSYEARTAEWGEFPSGRWEGFKSNRFADVSLESAFCQPEMSQQDALRAMWGEPCCDADMGEIFAGFLQGKVKLLPWCEKTLHTETTSIQTDLLQLNRMGFFTINSQPNVDGARSDHPLYGWGGPDGYVFQKSYVEFFTSPKNARLVAEVLKHFPSMTFTAVNMRGKVMGGSRWHVPTAVTWGVFPDKEILQPTVVDPISFAQAWKDEAFVLWKCVWQPLYDIASPSFKYLETIHDTYFLVSIVDNEFHDNRIFEALSLVARRRSGESFLQMGVELSKAKVPVSELDASSESEDEAMAVEQAESMDIE